MKNTLLSLTALSCLVLGGADSSAQEVAFTVEVSQIRLCWQSTVGSRYQVQYRSAQDPNVWVDLGATITAAASQTCVEDAYVIPERTYRVIVPAIPDGPSTMAWIEPGTFVMGSPASELARQANEGPQTQVTITRGFWMDKYEVTQQQYLDLMGVNPSRWTGNMTRPVEQVTWYDATNYCRLLNDRERAAGRLPAGYAYRLPTEAEWEYACRAGTSTPFHYGNELRSGMINFDGRWEYPPCNGDTNACYNPDGIYLGRTVSVGSYAPNEWGLYDMHGNVWEWVADWYSRNHPGGNVTDPTGAPTHTNKLIKGGRFYYYGSSCRSAYRTGHIPSSGRLDLGFRTVLAPVQ